MKDSDLERKNKWTVWVNRSSGQVYSVTETLSKGLRERRAEGRFYMNGQRRKYRGIRTKREGSVVFKFGMSDLSLVVSYEWIT